MANGIKLLISGLSNSGKTTLLKDLDPQNTLVVSHDGKRFPFPIPHIHIDKFVEIEEFCVEVENKIATFEAKFGHLPKVVALDSVSKLLLSIETSCCERIKSFPYSEINKQIATLMDFVESLIREGISVIMLSHAMYNKDTASYELVNAGGSFGKKGGVLSEVDNGSYIEVKGKKRIVHHRHPKLAARSVLDSDTLPDEVEMEKYNLQHHFNLLTEAVVESAEWELS